IDYAAVAWRVGVPTVARAGQIIHSGADGFGGRILLPTALIAERRRVISRRAQLIEGVVGVGAEAVGPARDDARGELVGRQCLYFVRRRDGIGAALVAFHLAVFDGENRNVYREVVAFEQLELEMNQLRFVALIREPEPVHAAFGQTVAGEVRLLRVRRRA